MALEVIKEKRSNPDKNKEARRRMKNSISEIDFQKVYSDPDTIAKLIFIARANKTNGLCPKCHRSIFKYQKLPGKLTFKCDCGKKVSPLKGTVLEQCRMKLDQVFVLLYEIYSSSHGYSVREAVRKKFKSKKYKHIHRVMAALGYWMGITLQNEKFPDGAVIQIDEVYPFVSDGNGTFGGERRKLAVFTLVDAKSGLVKVYPRSNADHNTARQIFENNFNDTHKILTDGSRIYFPLYNDYKILSVNHSAEGSKDRYARKELIETEKGIEELTVSTNDNECFNRSIKVSIHRIHNGICDRYASSYLFRMAFVRTFASKTIYDAIDALFSSLPPLFEDYSALDIHEVKGVEYIWRRAA